MSWHFFGCNDETYTCSPIISQSALLSSRAHSVIFISCECCIEIWQRGWVASESVPCLTLQVHILPHKVRKIRFIVGYFFVINLINVWVECRTFIFFKFTLIRSSILSLFLPFTFFKACPGRGPGPPRGGRTWDLLVFQLFSLYSRTLNLSTTVPPWVLPFYLDILYWTLTFYVCEEKLNVNNLP